MTRELIGALFVQARAYDGRKRTELSFQGWDSKIIEKRLSNQVNSYRTFKKAVGDWPNHRPRLAYVVKVYLK